MKNFRALIVSEESDGSYRREVGSRKAADLPAGDVTIRVHYSSLNYKDALSATGNKGVTRTYPHTPGVDAAGTVLESRDPNLPEGAEVLVTGYDLGMNTSGGFAECIRVPSGWVVPLPAGLTMRETMILGTAGFTAALSLDAIREGGVQPDSGALLVTGATGGVGCMAVMLAAAAGYFVTAATGKTDRHDWLRALGAAEVLSRDEVLGPPKRLLLKSRWAGVIDSVGGAYLDSAIRAALPRGVVTTCGNVASPRLETNVYPFILRGLRLQGIDSAETPMARRREIWKKLAGPWKPAPLQQVVTECTLDELSGQIEAMLKGAATGRTLVRIAP